MAGLALLFGVAWWTGAATGGPCSDAAVLPAAEAGHAHTASGSAAESAGVVATAAGYTFVPQGTTTFVPGVPTEPAFAITGSDARPVTAFDVEHERPMHLVVVRRDAAGFQHLHPVLGPDGVFPPPAGTAPTPTSPRPEAPRSCSRWTCSRRATSPGSASPQSRVAQVDGYQVRLGGELVPGGPSQVFTTVGLDGGAVTDLEPYLGAFGHLVVLRRSDLSYLHVDPSAATPPRRTTRARGWPSPPTCPPWAVTGCSSSSGTGASCASPSSPS